MKSNSLLPRAQTNAKRLVRKAVRGISFIPILLGLVIVALFTVVAVNQYNDASRTTRIEGAKSQITSIITNAQRSYGAARQFASVTTAMAITGNVIPKTMHLSTAVAQNIYDGVVGLASQTILTAGDGLRLTYPVYPDDCQEIVLSSLSLTRRITVGTSVVRLTDQAIDMATLANACAVTTATVPLQLDFGFR
jgi:Tfp pilus assembly protein PilE